MSPWSTTRKGRTWKFTRRPSFPEERFIMMFGKKTLSLLMCAALVPLGIPEFGLQVDALIATGVSKGLTAQVTKEAP
jgi:hypothetical protein